MKLTRDAANDLLASVGYPSARLWADDKVTGRLNSLNLIPIPKSALEDGTNTLLFLCQQSLAHGGKVTLDVITAVDDKPVKKLSEPHQYRKSPGTLPGTQSLEAMYNRATPSRRWFAGKVLSEFADSNGYPETPSDWSVIIQRVDDAYVDAGGEPNLKQSRYDLFTARAVLHGYFSNLKGE